MILSGIWLPATLLAALFQAWRTALQQRLRAELTVNGAGLARYAWGAPVAGVLLAVWMAAGLGQWPALGPLFFVLCAGAGLAQVLGTNLLIMAFGYRNFVVGTAFSKTEAVQAALFAWLVLDERLTPLVIAGIVTGVVGVLVLALGGRALRGRELLGSLGNPATFCGLGAGGLFALTGVLVKQASLEIPDTDRLTAALVVLLVVVLLQTAMLGSWVALREPGTWRQVLVTWRTSGQVGLLAALGSACWFTGFAAAPVALVRVVGQIEVIFTLAFARGFLRERTRAHEVIGLLLVAAGVVLSLVGAIG